MHVRKKEDFSPEIIDKFCRRERRKDIEDYKNKIRQKQESIKEMVRDFKKKSKKQIDREEKRFDSILTDEKTEEVLSQLHPLLRPLLKIKLKGLKKEMKKMRAEAIDGTDKMFLEMDEKGELGMKMEKENTYRQLATENIGGLCAVPYNMGFYLGQKLTELSKDILKYYNLLTDQAEDTGPEYVSEVREFYRKFKSYDPEKLRELVNELVSLSVVDEDTANKIYSTITSRPNVKVMVECRETNTSLLTELIGLPSEEAEEIADLVDEETIVSRADGITKELGDSKGYQLLRKNPHFFTAEEKNFKSYMRDIRRGLSERYLE